jgi:hypothetical protein
MKVLKPGRAQKGWAKEYECTGKGNGNGGCGALLLVEQGDLFHTTQCARDETDYFVTFKCAACGVKTDIADSPFRGPDLPREPKETGR